MDSKQAVESEAKEDKTSEPAIILKFKKTSLLKRFRCSACPRSYKQLINLKYHIRREHFNMAAKVTDRDSRQINDVWLERVLNSDDFVEITKAGPNKYLMKKSNKTDGLEVLEATGFIDVAPLYQDRAGRRDVCCCVCRERVLVADYDRHLKDQHADVTVTTVT